MIKRNLFLFLLVWNINVVSAQDSCNCRLNLDSMISKVTHNYAGYQDKVNLHTQGVYLALIDSLKKTAAGKSSIADCYPLLEKFRLFFYDKHLQLSIKGGRPSPATSVPVTAQPAPQTRLTKAGIMQYLQDRKTKLLPMEGIWITDGYEIAVRFNTSAATYEAVVLTAANKNWSAGMLKFTSKARKNGFYTTVYYRGDFAKDTVRINLYKNFMEVENYGSWQKTFPITKDSISKEDFVKSHSSFGDFQFRYLDASTLYIALKSCDLSLKAILDSTLISQKKKLQTIPNWIVDFRSNSGGSTDVFSSLLPYLYTKPLIEKGSNHWMTPDNTNNFRIFLEENGKLLDSSTTRQIKSWIAFGDKNPNGWYIEHGDTTTYDSVYVYPKRVAVLSNKNNASSGETFLIDAKGLSDKVTVMGENSAGYLDYGNLATSSLPCNQLGLYIPARRANYLDAGVSYDRTGYPPDVYIPDGTKDWIQFVYAYWKAHPATTSFQSKRKN